MVCERLAWVVWIKSEPSSTPPRSVVELRTDSRKVLRLRNPRQQASLADAIFGGVRSYFEQNPPAGTRFAQSRRATMASVATAAAPPN